MAPQINTIFGQIQPESLGRTLTHEHVSMDFEHVSYRKPKDSEQHMIKCSWTLENLGWIQQWPYSHKDNLTMGDEACENAVIDSLKKFKAAGGGCIVENSTFGLNRRSEFLKNLSQETGVHIVAGTGYYVAPSQKESTLNSLTVETMTQHIVSELNDGAFDCPDVKCGFIGEVGCCHPLNEFERKSIQASAAGQEATGAPVSFHPGRVPESPFEIMRIFSEAGGNPKKAIMGHLERTIQDPGTLAEFAKEFGSYCQFDLFGIENSYYQIKPEIDFFSDAQRIGLIQSLINEKFEDKILMAHDIHSKHRLEKFGGHGYKHILAVTCPKMLAKGISQDQIDKILVKNPAYILSY